MSHPSHRSGGPPFPLYRWPGVSDEFAQTAWEALGKVYADGVPEAKAVVQKTRWEAAPAPTLEDYRLVGAEPAPTHNLLGLAESSGPTIIVFEADIVRQAKHDGLDLFTKTHEVLVHELQHRFGFNHINSVVRKAAAASMTAQPCSSCAREASWIS